MKEAIKTIDNKWVRLVVLVVVFINSASVMLGKPILPFDNEQIVVGTSIVAMVITEIWNHWKNNSYTNEAREADVYMSKLKERRK